MPYEFRKRLDYFLENGSLHGFRYLGKRCGLSHKLCWATLISLFAVNMGFVFYRTFVNFQDNIINIHVDRSYLHWTNTFPAISICFLKGQHTELIQNMALQYLIEKNMTHPKRFRAYLKTIQSYVFQSVSEKINPLEYCKTMIGSCGINVEAFQKALLPQHCSEFLFNVSFNGRIYADCEELFKLRRTEMGNCFMANSIYFHDLNHKSLPLKYDRSSLYRYLSLNYAFSDVWDLTVFVHSPDQFPYFNAEQFPIDEEDGVQHFFGFNTVEITNSNEVHHIPVDKRKCRFPHERLMGSDMPYSMSACFTELRIRIELEKCNCTMPTSPIEYEKKFCDYAGMMCLQQYDIAALTKDSHYTGSTQCLQSCLEMEVNDIAYIRRQRNDSTLGRLTVYIVNMPTERYQRTVAKTSLDLVVGFGGVISLFFGASLISIFEIIYIWFLRKF